jgi:hypothetical protein
MTKKEYGQGNRKRGKIRHSNTLIVDRKRVELEEGNSRGREALW